MQPPRSRSRRTPGQPRPPAPASGTAVPARVTRAAPPALTDVGQAHRILHAVIVGTSAVIAVGAIAIAFAAVEPSVLGTDFRTYEDAARSWTTGSGFYHARQLAGPYVIAGASAIYSGDILYPPVALLLFMPFLILPAPLWWIVPAAVLAWAIYRLRPAFWAWPMMAAAVVFPPSLQAIADGNPLIWLVAALAVSCVVTGPAVLVLLKPSLFPFALMGANRRRWWIALGLFALACLPFALMWPDWIRTLLNSNGSLLYSLRDVPLLAIPLVAWAGRHRELIEATRG